MLPEDFRFFALKMRIKYVKVAIGLNFMKRNDIIREILNCVRSVYAAKSYKNKKTSRKKNKSMDEWSRKNWDFTQ